MNSLPGRLDSVRHASDRSKTSLLIVGDHHEGSFQYWLGQHHLVRLQSDAILRSGSLRKLVRIASLLHRRIDIPEQSITATPKS
jgi:hypothetical protein